MKKNSNSIFSEVKRVVMSFNLTIVLTVILIFSVLALWALFISGPNRVEESKQKQAEALITEKVEDIKGLEQNVFRYVTYQGYTDDKLYWFDENCDVIVTKDISSLNYDGAKKAAKKDYGVTCDTIELAYGYDNPVYEIKGSGKYLLLDYDTLSRVYERDDE